jgi:hypothetical protein
VPRIFQKLLGGLWWILNFRPLRLIALLAFVLWSIDSVVTFWTDAAWFASSGFSTTFWHSRLWQIGLFLGFFFGCLGLAVPFMRVIAKPVESPQSAVSFPRALDFLGHWYALAPKLSWLVVLITAFLCARSFGANWMAFEALWHTPNILGVNERFWLGILPFASLLLGLVWKFALVLLLVVALGGGVRSLPFLAKRNPIHPVRWIRSLIILGVFAIALRGLGYMNQILSLSRGSELTGYEAFVKTPVFVFGIALCVLSIVAVLRGAKRRTLLFSVVALLFLPAVINIGLAPFLFWLPNLIDSSKATKLAFQSIVIPTKNQTKTFEESWPIWGQSQLLDAARMRRSGIANQQLNNWERASLFLGEDKKWYAGIVGQKVPLLSYKASLSADESNAQEWLTLKLNELTDGIPVVDERFKPADQAFFGLGGKPLFAENPYLGVNIRGLSGLLWSWRLRSPFLKLDAAGKPRIYPVRGTQEAARKIAPMFEWSEARPVWDNGAWWWVCDGYSVSSDFPNVKAKTEGFFEGRNFGRLSLRAIQNPNTGGIRFVPIVDGQSKNDPIYSLWKAALPQLISDAPQVLDSEQTIDEIEKIVDSSRPVWTNGGRLVPLNQIELSARRVGEQIERIDESVRRDFKANDEEVLEQGIPCLWRGNGQWWLGMVYFAVANTDTGERVRNVKLYEIVVTQIGATSIGFGNSIADARSEFLLEVQLKEAQKKSNSKKNATVPLDVLALQAHDRAQKALSERDMIAAGREWDKQRKLLEELIKSRSKP